MKRLKISEYILIALLLILGFTLGMFYQQAIYSSQERVSVAICQQAIDGFPEHGLLKGFYSTDDYKVFIVQMTIIVLEQTKTGIVR